MTGGKALLGLAAVIMAGSAARTATPLWNGIEAGIAPGALSGRMFVDSRAIFHGLSRQYMMTDFYLQRDDPAIVRVLFAGKPRAVCGVNLEGMRSASERATLLTELGPPSSRATEELLDSPGGAAALLNGGKLFRIWTWYRGWTVIRFEERIRPGYFVTYYRATDARGHSLDC